MKSSKVIVIVAAMLSISTQTFGMGRLFSAMRTMYNGATSRNRLFARSCVAASLASLSVAGASGETPASVAKPTETAPAEPKKMFKAHIGFRFTVPITANDKPFDKDGFPTRATNPFALIDSYANWWAMQNLRTAFYGIAPRKVIPEDLLNLKTVSFGIVTKQISPSVDHTDLSLEGQVPTEDQLQNKKLGRVFEGFEKEPVRLNKCIRRELSRDPKHKEERSETCDMLLKTYLGLHKDAPKKRVGVMLRDQGLEMDLTDFNVEVSS